MHLTTWKFGDPETITIQDRKYDVCAALRCSKDLEVKGMLVELMDRSFRAPCFDRFMDFVSHVAAVNRADLSFPILLNEDGAIIDGRHRLAKAILEGKKKIKYVKFDEDPSECYEAAR